MNSLDNREKAFEAKFQHDESIKFKVEARRAKLVGLWAAGKLGLAGDAAADYAKSVIKADMAEQGVEDIIAKIKADFAAHKVEISDHQIRRELDEQLSVAKQQIMAE